MTALDRKLAQIAGRADAATNGPWAYERDEDGYSMGWITVGSYFNRDHKTMFDVNGDSAQQELNAVFVAHARTDVPALLRLVAVLREQLGVARLFVHRDWCFVNDCSNETPCRDYFDGIERSDAAALAALEGE